MFLTSTDQFEVRLALDDNEILAAQRLRYKVFIEEFGASLPKNDKNERLERDKFDQYCDHLILIDKCSKNYSDGPPVVGTIRLMESTVAEKALGFYSATEYHLDKLVAKHKNSLEIGRACVDKKYRASIAMHFL
ncbi:MAG: GNAT family N-acetyltransferase, partial [Rhodobacteraceae bacterium]